MSTAIFEVALSIPVRISELERLIRLADVEIDRNEPAYNTLCRACCVLLASHLEGFLKDLTKSIIYDLNFHLKSFANMPEAIKWSFCEKIAFYEGIPQDDVNQRAKQLSAFFSQNSVPIDLQAIQYKENKNKNPCPDFVDSILAKIGVPSVLASISGGALENIFKDEISLSYIIRKDIKKFRSYLHKFPYRKLPIKYTFVYPAKKSGKKASSLWSTYIDEILSRRHNIVHGDTMSNETNTKALLKDVEKMDVLMHGIMYSSVTYINFPRSKAGT